MLSAVIRSALGYPAFTVGTITGTLEPNPWNTLQPQVAKSRHRGAKPSRRCELLGKISLLSLE
ncbi:hypothetical protein S245_056696 [Arachis hypogaea]